MKLQPRYFLNVSSLKELSPFKQLFLNDSDGWMGVIVLSKLQNSLKLVQEADEEPAEPRNKNKQSLYDIVTKHSNKIDEDDYYNMAGNSGELSESIFGPKDEVTKPIVNSRTTRKHKNLKQIVNISEIEGAPAEVESLTGSEQPLKKQRQLAKN